MSLLFYRKLKELFGYTKNLTSADIHTITMRTRKRLLVITLFTLSSLFCALLYTLYWINRPAVNLSHFDEPEDLLEETTSNETETEKEPRWFVNRHNTYGFHPVNDKGVYSYWNVCIEAIQKPVQNTVDFLGRTILYNETQQIVVYNSFFRNGMQKVYTAGSSNSAWNHWDVFFSRSAIPKSHSFRKNTVYFVTSTCAANFHHFWIDEFVPLYAVIKQANKLKPSERNQILYRRPSDILDGETRMCSNKTVFEALLKTLYISNFHDVFYKITPNTCFSSGVFGISPIRIIEPREIVEHVLQEFNISRSNVRAKYITFIQRSYRLIENVNELVQVTKSAGFSNVQVVALESLDVHTQAKIAAESKVMIGVQGAGLQWAIFMPPGATLVEIAWPYKHWGFYFSTYVAPYQIRHVEMKAKNVHVNWTSYEAQLRGGREVSVEERLQLLQQPPKSGSFDNIWKYADVWINKEDLLERLIGL